MSENGTDEHFLDVHVFDDLTEEEWHHLMRRVKLHFSNRRRLLFYPDDNGRLMKECFEKAFSFSPDVSLSENGVKFKRACKDEQSWMLQYFIFSRRMDIRSGREPLIWDNLTRIASMIEFCYQNNVVVYDLIEAIFINYQTITS